MAQVLEQCCCGLMSLRSSVRLILILHLMYNAFYVFITAGNIILHVPIPETPPGPSTSENDLTSQSWWAAWCLAGLPLIITGLWAVASKYDIVLRIYMVYLACTSIMDVVCFWQPLLEHDACELLPPNLQFHGFSFACGFTRFFVFGFATLLALTEAYAILLVWSYCEEITDQGVDNLGFADLRAGAKEALFRQNKEHYGGILGYSDHTTLYGKRKEPVQVCVGPNYGIQDMGSIPKHW
eukprot:gnl/MRDRNA2_/MRDRNA2_104173_c0_seq1.p1 gnl/MRDRNA2_/MRDRNA2_104173_c0~~gnl/MRDRNA2_/MRDRNA2_104173_c0_seq1.p1  ORF type:complete len:239 (+),score=20.26 gnl/MRDRNA2_/MRDRNA2_104173_c0_seq1:96-812(+)